MKLLRISSLCLLSIWVSLVGMEQTQKKTEILTSPFVYETTFYNSENGVTVLLLGRSSYQSSTKGAGNYLEEKFLKSSVNSTIQFLIHEPQDHEFVSFCIDHYNYSFLRAQLLNLATDYKGGSVNNLAANCLFESAILYHRACSLTGKKKPYKEFEPVIDLSMEKIEKVSVDNLLEYGYTQVSNCYNKAAGKAFKKALYTQQEDYTTYKEEVIKKLKEAFNQHECGKYTLQRLMILDPFNNLLEEGLFDQLRWTIFKSNLLLSLSLAPKNSMIVVIDPSFEEKREELKKLMLSLQGFNDITKIVN